ncbi:MAG: VOC family protein [Gemmatimonadota bacterium]
MNDVTPLITVDDVDPCLPFWTDRFGFEVVATVPHGEGTGFAMLQKGDVVVMYQSRASIQDDLEAEAPGHPGLADRLAAGVATLFIKVDDLDPVVAALAGADVVVPRRQTFYGMDEIFVMAPCGTLVGFAAPLAEEGGDA